MNNGQRRRMDQDMLMSRLKVIMKRMKEKKEGKEDRRDDNEEKKRYLKKTLIGLLTKQQIHKEWGIPE